MLNEFRGDVRYCLKMKSLSIEQSNLENRKKTFRRLDDQRSMSKMMAGREQTEMIDVFLTNRLKLQSHFFIDSPLPN